MGGDVLGYPDIIRISSGYPLLKFSDFFRILGPCGLNFKAIMLKLGVNDHLMGAGDMGYLDIRLYAFEIFGFYGIFGSCSYNFQAIVLKLGVNDHLMGADVSGNSDIRIFSFEIFGFLADFLLLFPYFTTSKQTQ